MQAAKDFYGEGKGAEKQRKVRENPVNRLKSQLMKRACNYQWLVVHGHFPSFSAPS